MRCDEVIQELATAGGLDAGRDSGPPSPALAEHLARCPRCADWARRDARLGRLWEATRPEEPGPEAWASAWAAASRAADAATHGAPSRALPRSQPRPWRRLAWGAVAVAQAAVLVVATWLIFTAQPDPGRPRPRVLPKNALALNPEVEVPDLEPAPALAPIPAPDPALARAVPGATVEIDPGVTVLIRSNGPKVEVVSLAVDEGFGSGAVDPLYVWYNEQEAGAQ